jgi:hypothetical protein
MMTGSQPCVCVRTAWRQPFFDDQPESEPVSYLCQEIRNNDRFASAGHTERYAVLGNIPKPRLEGRHASRISTETRKPSI